mmetsp:Transcript_24661/g.48375  ORF Transcript_24661/g.48375 Transcript_24661/m.48375 type:complete len:85 (-) Transcript_24661:897-1151(-)
MHAKECMSEDMDCQEVRERGLNKGIQGYEQEDTRGRARGALHPPWHPITSHTLSPSSALRLNPRSLGDKFKVDRSSLHDILLFR